MGEAAPEEIALGKYRSTIESRVVAAIRPADGEGEGSGALLPVLHDMAGVGSTWPESDQLASRPSSRRAPPRSSRRERCAESRPDGLTIAVQSSSGQVGERPSKGPSERERGAR